MMFETLSKSVISTFEIRPKREFVETQAPLFSFAINTTSLMVINLIIFKEDLKMILLTLFVVLMAVLAIVLSGVLIVALPVIGLVLAAALDITICVVVFKLIFRRKRD